jgi:hypothetical protein
MAPYLSASTTRTGLTAQRRRFGPRRDGVIIHVLLHVVDGFMDELEIFREDSTPIRGAVDPANLKIEIL